MILKAILQGMFDSNCYILGDEGEAAVIDPGADVEDITGVLGEHGLKLKYIILTHAHLDHIVKIDELRSALGGKTVLHKDDAPLMGNPLLNGSSIFRTNRTFGMADILVSDGDVLELGKAKLDVIHTPGHTPGGMCILVRGGVSEENSMSDSGGIGGQKADVVSSMSESGGCIFTGDTLFRLSIGRTDLGAGDSVKMQKSLKRLMELDGTMKVYPGHGPSTTIDFERRNNHWLY